MSSCIVIIFLCCVHAVGTANPAKKKKKKHIIKKNRPESPPLPQTAAPATTVGSSPLALLPQLPLLSSLPAQVNQIKDVQPDEDGYYTFNVHMIT